MIKNIDVYAFVGPSGTGKSYRAQMVASKYDIKYIICYIIYIYIIYITLHKFIYSYIITLTKQSYNHSHTYMYYHLFINLPQNNISTIPPINITPFPQNNPFIIFIFFDNSSTT